MKVILKKQVDKLGEQGEIVEVANGYGRNYLIPQGLALMATEGTIRAQQEELRQQARKRRQEQEEAQNVANELESLTVPITVRVGEEDRIHGTVTNQQVAVELSKRGFDINRRDIEVPDEIRTTGTYTAQVKVHPEVTANLKIEVLAQPGG